MSRQKEPVMQLYTEFKSFFFKKKKNLKKGENCTQLYNTLRNQPPRINNNNNHSSNLIPLPLKADNGSVWILFRSLGSDMRLHTGDLFTSVSLEKIQVTQNSYWNQSILNGSIILSCIKVNAPLFSCRSKKKTNMDTSGLRSERNKCISLRSGSNYNLLSKEDIF